MFRQYHAIFVAVDVPAQGFIIKWPGLLNFFMMAFIQLTFLWPGRIYGLWPEILSAVTVVRSFSRSWSTCAMRLVSHGMIIHIYLHVFWNKAGWKMLLPQFLSAEWEMAFSLTSDWYTFWGSAPLQNFPAAFVPCSKISSIKNTATWQIVLYWLPCCEIHFPLATPQYPSPKIETNVHTAKGCRMSNPEVQALKASQQNYKIALALAKINSFWNKVSKSKVSSPIKLRRSIFCIKHIWVHRKLCTKKAEVSFPSTSNELAAIDRSTISSSV